MPPFLFSRLLLFIGVCSAVSGRLWPLWGGGDDSGDEIVDESELEDVSFSSSNEEKQDGASLEDLNLISKLEKLEKPKNPGENSLLDGSSEEAVIEISGEDGTRELTLTELGKLAR